MNRDAQFWPRSLRRRPLPALLAASAVVALNGCGGASGNHQTHHAPPATSVTVKTGSATTPSKAGGIHASLRGSNHTPVVGKPWGYSLTATNAAGKPLSGSVTIEFLFGGQVVGHDTPPTHRLTRGHLRGKLTFPKRSIGIPLQVGAVIHTQLGSKTLTWPVKVERGSH